MRNPVLAIATLLAILVAGFFVLGPGYKWKARSFFKQLQQCTTAAQIQEWALEEIERADGKQVEIVSIPSFLDAPDGGPPNSASIEYNDGEPYLVATWDGGFGHWGLLVGSSSLEYPYGDCYHVEWTPGVYVWHEIQK